MKDTNSKPLSVEISDGIKFITLNRPNRRNSLDEILVELLIQEIQQPLPEVVDLLVIRGAGKAFCSGFDLSDLAMETDATLAYRFLRLETLLQLIVNVGVPTVALAHGAVYGAGADLFMACHYRIAEEDVRISFPGIRFGVILGTGRLSSRIGVDAARRTLVRREPICSAEALVKGIVTDIAGENEWANRIEEIRSDGQLIDRATKNRMSIALSRDFNDNDFTALARSVTEPGLKQRIVDYVERISS